MALRPKQEPAVVESEPEVIDAISEPVPSGGAHLVQDNVSDPENPALRSAVGTTVQDNSEDEDGNRRERTTHADGTVSDHVPDGESPEPATVEPGPSEDAERPSDEGDSDEE